MDDLLKDAIADAKAVRETALENAKIALEEAFTPRLQSMLSKKIQSEIEVDEGEHEDDEDVEEGEHEDDEVEERGEMRRDGDEIEDDEVEEGEHEEEDEIDESDIIEIDGVKYAPVVSEEEDEEDEVEEGEERGDDDDVDEDLDLDEILKELDEEGVNEEEEIDEIEEVDEDVDEIEENDVSSGIGKGDNSHDKKSGDSTDIGKAGKAKHESVEAVSEGEHEDEDDDKKDESVEEDIDLEEIVKALSEEEDEEEKKDENSKLQSELEEHRNVVKYLRSKLNEVNLLNAKLLFTNKLFRSYGLNNDQKMKVVETFDRAHNLREVKLVYSTLAESFGSKQTKTEIKESKKGSASKAVASTKSEKQEVIAEGHEMRDRFKKLAGIL